MGDPIPSFPFLSFAQLVIFYFILSEPFFRFISYAVPGFPPSGLRKDYLTPSLIYLTYPQNLTLWHSGALRGENQTRQGRDWDVDCERGGGLMWY